MSRKHECASCGADHYEEGSLKNCPHCDAEKCSVCDMGDDTSCITCEGQEDENEDE